MILPLHPLYHIPSPPTEWTNWPINDVATKIDDKFSPDNISTYSISIILPEKHFFAEFFLISGVVFETVQLFGPEKQPCSNVSPAVTKILINNHYINYYAKIKQKKTINFKKNFYNICIHILKVVRFFI